MAARFPRGGAIPIFALHPLLKFRRAQSVLLSTLTYDRASAAQRIDAQLRGPPPTAAEAPEVERIGGTKSFSGQSAVSQGLRIGLISTRRRWKFPCRADDRHFRSTGCSETRILTHLCLPTRISIVPVLVRSEYYRLLDGAVR